VRGDTAAPIFACAGNGKPDGKTEHKREEMSMRTPVSNMDVRRPTRYSATREWISLVKRTIARFTRGNIAAQKERVLLPDEQQEQHDRAKKIIEGWRDRQAG
jgi:hypothetical protein